MSIRTYICCDYCNPQGIRTVEQRRNIERGDRSGRRWTDGRAWYEGALETAVEKYGWQVSDEGMHICPHCREKFAAAMQTDLAG